MSAMPDELLRAAQVCAICHDQCVSACPVVETTRRMAAYPSRLAMLALELERGALPASDSAALALQNCINCGACLEACIYQDAPNDITPVVRWTRELLQARGAIPEGLKYLLGRVQAHGTPYGYLRPTLERLRAELFGEADVSSKSVSPSVLLFAGAAALHFAPETVISAVRLLKRTGMEHVVLAETLYAGEELWQYGSRDAFEFCARTLAAEVHALQPERVIVIDPSSAYLLREVYPRELGLVLDAPVQTLAETLTAEFPPVVRPDARPVYLIVTAVEAYRQGGGAAPDFLDRCGIPWLGRRTELPFRWMSYPEGAVIDLPGDPKAAAGQRVAAAVRDSSVEKVVVTGPQAWAYFRQALPAVEVIDLATFALELLD